MNWSELEQKYNIKFRLANGEFRPVNEWLDDLYLRSNPEELGQIFYDIFNNGHVLFVDLTTHKN